MKDYLNRTTSYSFVHVKYFLLEKSYNYDMILN